MTTIQQVKQIVQPLLAQNADLALVGRMIVIRPIRHLFRGILIDRTSTADDFRPKWAVYPLFEREVIFGCNWGGVIFNPLRGAWLVHDPRTSTMMRDEIESVALQQLRPLQTIEDFVAFASKERFPDTALSFYKRRKLFVDLALGDLESAREIAAYCKNESMKPAQKFAKWEKALDIYIAETVCPLIEAGNKIGIARLLRDLEAAAVKKEKLEKLWGPTPFPMEIEI